jgi:hypothetical protein
MAYTINRWDGTAIAVIEDGTVNQSLDVKLIGKNYAGYGEIQNENTLHMLENFAGATYPANAIRGQLWYNTTEKKLKLHTGDVAGGVKIWKSIGGADYATNEPSVPNNGDFWFDTNKDQLKVRNGDSWLAIGPQSAGDGVTQLVSKQVRGFSVGSSTPENFSIIIAYINDRATYIIAEDEFTLDTSDAESVIIGFSLLKKGLTLQNTDPATGVSGVSSSHYYWGTAGNALRLGGFEAADYVRSGSSNFTATVRFSDDGYTVGDSDDLACFIDGGTEPTFQNVTGPRIYFKVRDGSDIKNPLTINASTVVSGADDTYNLGTTTNRWHEVHSVNFRGIADQADELFLNGVGYTVASTSATTNSIAARDGSGNLTSNTFIGNATSATKLRDVRKINGVNFDGTTDIIIQDSTRVSKSGDTMSGFLTLHAQPQDSLHAATKNYVDGKFGVGGILGIASGGTSANTATNARTNLDVPSRSGSGASGTWGIDISGKAALVNVSGNGRSASTGANANTIAARDSSADIYANVFHGTATAANYADLAEKYLAADDYNPGTVVTVCTHGDHEVEACSEGSRAIGAVSTNPAYMMNSGLEGGTYIALKGRIPVLITGPVNKGDEIIPADGGCGKAGEGKVFAVALESNDSADIKLVECLIL